MYPQVNSKKKKVNALNFSEPQSSIQSKVQFQRNWPWTMFRLFLNMSGTMVQNPGQKWENSKILPFLVFTLGQCTFEIKGAILTMF